ncbi:teichoic acids export ABC transporter ATP-binding subunit TagH [Jeotgalibacillus haloalkalitolerans]|uniref:Teichoic acids export ABC transporter ATP-binding subunit TagH n=1 Tax=Jeotgalibacillus haloalkalitolerans TaxID=3104292 RepID=A0ABU5KJN1_9BACL|nr:teichoic acids export ABC transporter ATP-binding subunit TagH [Jeotgalibacillus sp. HH7-29]MDZ5711298.1 teichoic acids export ABC transporter ATP-binding subunit TagH [Jeotgalibacillus sp. HH7-29]
MEKSIIVNNVAKRYKLYQKPSEKILDLLLPKSYGEEFFALRGVSFEAEKGDVIGFIGVNGSGKSTLSNILAGIVPPTYGDVTINGQTALIAVQSGLDNNLTGRDNIELKCLMLGFTKEQIKELEPEIIDFADLGKFIDQPVKSYSSGMKSRLGFAISVTIDPDILVIDEALSVGDKSFAEKCLDKMNEFKARGKTIFFVSHSVGQMKRFCDKALWLEFGKAKEFGPIEEVMPKYEKFLEEYKSMSKKEQKTFRQKGAELQSAYEPIT